MKFKQYASLQRLILGGLPINPGIKQKQQCNKAYFYKLDSPLQITSH